MVITVTINPAMDKTIAIEDLKLGKVNRISELRFDIGGKGINVSKVLKNFGIESVATGFLGGVWKDKFIHELSKRDIKSDFVFVDGDTRTNTKIIDSVNKINTDINEKGPFVEDEKLNEFLCKFQNLCKKGDIVVLSGGICPGVPKDIYFKLCSLAKERGAYVVMDAEGELLKEGIKAKPNLIKPNNFELLNFVNSEDDSEENLISIAKDLNKSGIEKIMVSLGHKGALFITDNNVYKSEAIKVDVKSTVGAGDSMVAAIIYSYINKFSHTDTLKYAVASGTSTVTLEGTEACSLGEVKKYVNLVKVMEV